MCSEVNRNKIKEMGVNKTICTSFGLNILLIFATTANLFTYSRWKLVRVGPWNSTTRRNHFMDEVDKMENAKVIDVIKDYVDLGIGPEADVLAVSNLQEKFGVGSRMLHEDIGEFLSKVNRGRPRKRSVRDDSFDSYMNIDRMEEFFKTLADSYPAQITLKTVGHSYEGRNISLFIISSRNVSASAPCEGLKQKPRPSSYPANTRQRIKNLPIRKGRFRRPILRRRRLRRGQLSNSSWRREGNKDQWEVPLRPHFLKGLRRKISGSGKAKGSSTKPMIFIDAGLHPREWVTPAAALYLIKKLAETPSLTANIDWLIMPMANPDGYKFSWEYDRFWRKTRSKTESSGCFGVDMNRNFDFRWGEVDTSSNPCSEHYGGKGPNSEIETQIIARILSKHKRKLKVYISLHNWGQDILYPFCHSDKDIPRNALELERISKGMVNAIQRSQSVNYRTGRGAALLYPASGTSMDWAYDIGVQYSYLFELRDKHGIMGFILPDIFIKPTGEDLLAAMKYLASELSKEG